MCAELKDEVRDTPTPIYVLTCVKDAPKVMQQAFQLLALHSHVGHTLQQPVKIEQAAVGGAGRVTA